MLLAAGRGSRIQPLSDRLPKSMIHCAGRPIISHLISSFIESGISDFSIGVGWKAERLEDFIRSEVQATSVNLVQVSNYSEGPLRTFLTASSKLQKGPFVVIPADIITTSSNIRKVANQSLKNDALVTLAVDPDGTSGTEVYVGEDGHVSGLGKNKNDTKIGVSAQMLSADYRFLEECNQREGEGYTLLSELINALINDGRKVIAVPIRDYWKDIDTIDSLLDANSHLLTQIGRQQGDCIYIPQGDAMEFGQELVLDSNIKIGSKTKIIGPTLIMPDSKIGEDTTIGPYASLSAGSEVGQSCLIRNTIVFGNGLIENGTTYSNVVVFDNIIAKR